jgi:hypothetical protein
MRYTKRDYTDATAILHSNARVRERFAPQELRLVGQVRIAYLHDVDVPLTDMKLVRAIFEHWRRAERTA